MLKLPKLIGHRGACGYAPENTLESIKTAADMGVTWVEFDVKLTRDGVPILFHDDTLERTTDGSGAVKDTDFAVLRDLDAGGCFGESFSGVVIPTLEEALDVLIDLDMGMNLEIKPCAGREIETAETALDILSRVWDDADKLLISSFSHVSLETALDLAPDWHRGLLLETDIPENWKEFADYLEVSTINFDGRATSREQVAMLRTAKKPLLAYTINDADLAEKLYAWGVSSVFTDMPDMIE
jgi:glycerophosphoryl diester phosphodiesterase